MYNLKAQHPTIINQLISKDKSLLIKAFLALTATIVLWISAKVQIPFYPVPMTMQPFVVLVVGMAFGSRLAFATILLYLLEGAAGLPVFAGTPEKGIGIAYMFGPTGGYLLGFLVAATFCGWLAERGFDRNVITTFIAMFLGTAIIYLFGVLWLGSVLGWDKPILSFGLYPFIYGDLFKICLAALTLPMAWKLINKLS